MCMCATLNAYTAPTHSHDCEKVPWTVTKLKKIAILEETTIDLKVSSTKTFHDEAKGIKLKKG